MAEVYLQGGGAGHISAALQVRTANMDVLLAGTVITADNRNLQFQIKDLRIVLEFINDPPATEPRMEPSETDKSTLTLRLYNFNNNLGTGTTSPVRIGNLFGRPLFLAFMVHALSQQSSKTVHYTFMLGGGA